MVFASPTEGAKRLCLVSADGQDGAAVLHFFW